MATETSTVDAGTTDAPSADGSSATPELSTRTKLRLLWSYARPHRGMLLLGMALGLLGTGAELVTPMVSKWVLDGLAVDAALHLPITVLAVVLVAGTVIGLAQGILLGTLAERIILAARTGMVRHLLRAPVPVLARRTGGEMVTRVTSDTMLIREATTSTIVEGINGVVAVVGSLVLMAVLDLPLLLVTLGVVATVSVAAVRLMAPLAAAQQQAQEEIGRMGARLEGVLRAIRTVKAARAVGREEERVSAYAAASAAKAVRAVRLEMIAWSVTGAGINLAILVVLGLGAWRVSTGQLAVSSLIAFLLYLFQLVWPVMMLTMAATSLQSGLAAAARIHEVTSLPQEADDAEDGAAPTPVPDAPALELADVRFRYAPDAPWALDGVDLVVPRRGHTAIVGPSGAGKTTVLSLLLRFLEPSTGQLRLDGWPFDDWSLRELRRRIAYVEQDTPLVPGTLRENLTYARPDASEEVVWRALEAVRLAERVRALPDGLDADVTGTVLSGGERQRVAIARAIASEPELLLLDEVTAQLDGLTELAVTEAIREQARRGAVVTIAHRLSTVMDADRIVLLEAGRVRAVGSHDELLATDGLYAELVAALRIGDRETADGVRA